ncbi:hypothetical protein F4821DRAFT_50747 [Hypoxylon rubiginosum]|uniref:Uncharacterized protein n=1 Tax=Hypoxylon rubiginosum TaxID=110542 RepID=A0ACC0DAB2_9PEZI|nr:hypothetical protein F4821DRAFT_50747 [Hypoxylon rubiginosum]
MDNRVFADISVKPIRVRFRTGSQYYDPFPTLQFMKYNSPQGEPMELAEYHSLRRRSHNFDQHRPSMPQGTGLPQHLPQSVPRKPPQPTGYGHRHNVTLANLRPSIPAFAGNMPEAVRGPDFATYPTEAPQQQAGPQVISSIPEHVVSSEPENMCTKSPSASCITPAIRTESLAFEEAVVPEVGHSVNQGSTLKVVIPSDSPPSSRGYYTPPENPMPKSAGVESSEQAQFEENLHDDGGAEEDQEEIDYGTVIRRRARPHLSLPTNWVSEGTPDVRQPGGEDNSDKLRAIEANDEKSSGSRDTSAEYVPALAYQPEDSRPASAPGQHRVDNSSAEDSVQSSFPQSNSGGQGEANPLHTSVSAKQDHDESKISGKFVGSDEHGILGDSSGAKHESPQPINQSNPELLHQQQNRERLDTANTVNTVIFSPAPVSDIAKPASSTANQTSGTVKPTSTATRRIPSAVWSGLAGATKTAAATKPTPAAVTKPTPAVVTMPAPAESRNPSDSGKYTGPVIVDGSSGKASAFRKSATPSNPASAASTGTDDQPDIREWLNANRHSESPEAPTDPAAFSRQFSEVEAAIRLNTPSSKASPASNASSSSSSIEVKTGMTPPTAAPQGTNPTGPAVNPAAMFSPEARSQAFQIIGISTPTPSDRSSEPFPAYTDPMNSPTGAGFPYHGVHARLAQVQQHMGHGRRPSWPPHPFRVPDDHPLAEANYRQSRANVARQASVRAPAPPQNTPAGTPASQLSPAKAPVSTPQHIRAPSSTSSPLNPRAKEFKPAPAAHSTATSAKEESKSAPAAAPMDQSPTATRETQKGRSAWQEKKKAKARAKQREKRLIKREAENATKEKNDSTQESAAAANDDVSGATEKDDDKKSDENGTAHGTVEKQDSAKDAAVEDGAKDAVENETKIDLKKDTKKDTEEQDPKKDTQNDAKDTTDSAAKDVVKDAASKEDVKTAPEKDTVNDTNDAKKDAKVDAKDDAKKADGSVKTSLSGNESIQNQLAERRNLASIKVAIPLGFSKMKQNGSNGKATISPLSKQPQLQLPSPQPAITSSTHTLSTPTAPESRNSAIRTEVQSPTRAPSQQMTPRTLSQRTPMASSQRPSYTTTPMTSSQRPSYTTPTAYSQQSTSPRRGSIGSTIPVLSSGDTPQRPQVESRPAFNAWSQGPPKMGRKPQNTIQESPTKKSPGSS